MNENVKMILDRTKPLPNELPSVAETHERKATLEILGELQKVYASLRSLQYSVSLHHEFKEETKMLRDMCYDIIDKIDPAFSRHFNHHQ